MAVKLIWPLLLFYINRISLTDCLRRVSDSYSFKFEAVEANQKSPEQGTLIIANHRSVLDPLVVMNHVAQLGMLHGQGISKSKWYSRIFWYFVHRHYKKIRVSYLGDSGVFRRWIRCLRAGENVMFFPEGTRNTSDQPILRFQPGAEKLIKASKAGLLMYYIPDSERALASGSAKKPVSYKYFAFEDITDEVEILYRKTFSL